MSPSLSRLASRDFWVAILLAAAVAAPYASLPFWASTAALLIAAVLVWRAGADGAKWYAAALAAPVSHSLMALRISAADVLVLPIVAREALGWWKGRERVQSTLLKPLVLLIGVTAVAMLIGYFEIGQWSSWAVINKGAGLVFQVAVVLALIRCLRSIQDVQRLARWFVIGVSVSNLAMLSAVLVAIAGWPNPVYSSRLFGWMAQPTITGGLLMVAAMIELGCLAGTRPRGERGEPSNTENRTLRWVNLWLLGLSLGLTVSRSTWVAVAGAAAVMMAVLLVRPPVGRRPALSILAAVSVWLFVPVALLGNVLAMNLLAGVTLMPSDRAAELRAEIADACRVDPSLEFCREPQSTSAAASTADMQVTEAPAPGSPATAPDRAASAIAAARPPPSSAGASAAPDFPGAAAGPDVNNAMMNARGLNDRVAILGVAWNDYTSDVSSMVLGIGLGTFYATSADDFGVPLIIHNTFAWYLVEFGPIGLLIVLWLWIRTTANLWIALRATEPHAALAVGLLASLGGFVVFCLFNEGFYQRQLWLIMLLADRLALGVTAQEPREAAVHVPVPSRAAV